MSGEADLGLRTVEPTAEGTQDPLSSFAANLPDKSNDLSASLAANRRISPVKRTAITAIGAATALTGINIVTSPNTADAIYCDVAEKPDQALAVAQTDVGSSPTEAIDTAKETVLFTFQSPNGETVSVSLPDCKEVEEKDEIDKAIEEWITKDENGKYPPESMPYRFTDSRSFQILSIFQPGFEKHGFKVKTSMALQGKLVATQIVNGFLFVHIGFEDWGPSHDSTSVLKGENTRFTVPFILGGPLDDNKLAQTWTANSDDFLSGVSDFEWVSTNYFNDEFIPENLGETVAATFYPFKSSRNEHPLLKEPRFKNYIKYGNATIKTTRDLVRALYQLNNVDEKERKEFDEAEFSPNLSRIINNKVSSEDFNPADYPYLMGLIDK